ncbi:unnamed protein product [Mytilus coruscus]|uniref:Uncharacterized protein n=1 Tax=Mytilus coruscus TaxID=42192 RepID=A0A6J8BRP5_MYTCO|nr:unnamed protein product [Mytilus coruscus]
MFRYICREHCDIVPDKNINKTIANVTNYPSNCNCVCTVHRECSFCHEFCSRIAGGSSIDSSDSLFNLSSWSEDSIDIALCDGTDIPSASVVPIISFESENDTSDSEPNSESDGIELPRESDVQLTVPTSNLRFESDEEDSQRVSDSQGIDLPSLASPLMSYSDHFDEYDSQWLSDYEVNQPSFESVDPTCSFSDAETQWLTGSIGSPYVEFAGQSVSTAETNQSRDSRKAEFNFLGLNSDKNEEEILANDSDYFTNSVHLSKCRKL